MTVGGWVRSQGGAPSPPSGKGSLFFWSFHPLGPVVVHTAWVPGPRHLGLLRPPLPAEPLAVLPSSRRPPAVLQPSSILPPSSHLQVACRLACAGSCPFLSGRSSNDLPLSLPLLLSGVHSLSMQQAIAFLKHRPNHIPRLPQSFYWLLITHRIRLSG